MLQIRLPVRPGKAAAEVRPSFSSGRHMPPVWLDVLYPGAAGRVVRRRGNHWTFSLVSAPGGADFENSGLSTRSETIGAMRSETLRTAVAAGVGLRPSPRIQALGFSDRILVDGSLKRGRQRQRRGSHQHAHGTSPPRPKSFRPCPRSYVKRLTAAQALSESGRTRNQVLASAIGIGAGQQRRNSREL